MGAEPAAPVAISRGAVRALLMLIQLGYLAMYALASFKTDRMLAIVVVIALIGIALDRLVVHLRDRLVFWERLDSYYAE